MPLTAGTKLGPYEIRNQIGAGGMGEVYRATDTRLGRTVAIKVLHEHLAERADVRERFEREAKAVSSLNHPHICTLHDVGEQDGTHFLVMEYVEGATLQQRLEKGRLPLDQALEYAIQIADALDKAHRQGVVHRDLKPGNIMVTKAGVKLLDFGLAKLKGDASAMSPMSQMPTQGTAPLTAEGTILGTLQYMAPEQLEGKHADACTDIFAFGAVVYEMVTGKKAFEGESQASLIAAILGSQPTPMSTLQPMSPPALDRVVRKCLVKDPEDRWHSAHDLTDELKWIVDERLLKRDTDSGRVQELAAPGGHAGTIGGRQARIIHSWEAVARDGRAFSENGVGIMYWFRVPLGGVCHPEGFRNFLQPALENPHVSKIRFVLDSSVPVTSDFWNASVIPLLQGWAKRVNRDFQLKQQEDGGQFVEHVARPKVLAWVFADLAEEFSPSFKLFVDDLDTDEHGESQAQIFLSTTTRTVRFSDQTQHQIRIPDTILRVQWPEDESLLQALSRIVNQWEFLFS